MSMITAYEFTIASHYDEHDPDTILIEGTGIVLPTDEDKWFRVYGPGNSGLRFVIAADRVRRVRGLTDEDLTEIRDENAAAENAAQALLAAALDQLENVIGPWSGQDCTFIDGAILESGVTACMTHQRPGSAAGKCAIAEAIAFIDAHRPTA